MSKIVIKKTAEATGESIGNKVADRITKVIKASPQNNSKTVTNEHGKKINKERYVPLEEREETIGELRLSEYNNGVEKNTRNFKKFTAK